MVWPEAFTKYSSIIAEEAAVLVEGRVELTDDGTVTVVVDELALLGDILQRRAKSLTVRLPPPDDMSFALDALYKICDQHRGDCELLLEMFLPGEVLVRVRPHVALRVKGSVQLEASLKALGCDVQWAHRNAIPV